MALGSSKPSSLTSEEDLCRIFGLLLSGGMSIEGHDRMFRRDLETAIVKARNGMLLLALPPVSLTEKELQPPLMVKAAIEACLMPVVKFESRRRGIRWSSKKILESIVKANDHDFLKEYLSFELEASQFKDPKAPRALKGKVPTPAPVRAAIILGHGICLEILLQLGQLVLGDDIGDAIVSAKNPRALDVLLKNSWRPTTQLVLGAIPNAKLSVIQFLLQNGADLAVTAAFTKAICFGRCDVLEYLLGQYPITVPENGLADAIIAVVTKVRSKHDLILQRPLEDFLECRESSIELILLLVNNGAMLNKPCYILSPPDDRLEQIFLQSLDSSADTLYYGALRGYEAIVQNALDDGEESMQIPEAAQPLWHMHRSRKPSHFKFSVGYGISGKSKGSLLLETAIPLVADEECFDMAAASRQGTILQILIDDGHMEPSQSHLKLVVNGRLRDGSTPQILRPRDISDEDSAASEPECLRILIRSSSKRKRLVVPRDLILSTVAANRTLPAAALIQEFDEELAVRLEEALIMACRNANHFLAHLLLSRGVRPKAADASGMFAISDTADQDKITSAASGMFLVEDLIPTERIGMVLCRHRALKLNSEALAGFGKLGYTSLVKSLLKRHVEVNIPLSIPTAKNRIILDMLLQAADEQTKDSMANFKLSWRQFSANVTSLEVARKVLRIGMVDVPKYGAVSIPFSNGHFIVAQAYDELLYGN
ncbi:hypothetical protein BC829DRAFT_439475 [Chytridium lagenaria]|nr:hypothetical protein BC829DRAFT_439475 [Chytridium lagenaria]